MLQVFLAELKNEANENASCTYKTPNMTEDARPDDSGVDLVVINTNSIL